MQAQEIIDPHILLKHLVERTRISISEIDIKQFWEHVPRIAPQAGYVDHPASDSHIPVAIYGDAAKLSTAGGKMVGIFLSLPLWRTTFIPLFLLVFMGVSRTPVLQTPHGQSCVSTTDLVSLSLSLAFRGVGGHSFALTEYKAPVLRDAPGRSPYNTHVASTMGHGGLLHDHFVMRSMLQEEMHSVNITHLCQRPYVEHLSCCKGALHGSAVVAIHGGCLWQLQFTGSPVQQFGFVYWQSAEKDLCKCGIDESRVQ